MLIQLIETLAKKLETCSKVALISKRDKQASYDDETDELKFLKAITSDKRWIFTPHKRGLPIHNFSIAIKSDKIFFSFQDFNKTVVQGYVDENKAIEMVKEFISIYDSLIPKKQKDFLYCFPGFLSKIQETNEFTDFTNDVKERISAFCDISFKIEDTINMISLAKSESKDISEFTDSLKTLHEEKRKYFY